ncbi:MAG: glycosyltransferase family 1 protein [Promethearchaeota archaeon]|nr:MAG: glycosyltransferase family 1 protein [Candidatus Lokiarchaeota archaeon]
MEILSRSTILYINQTRQDSFDKLIGKGFSEALSWRNTFKKVIFICYSSNNQYLFKKIYGNCFLIGLPFDLSFSKIKSVINIGKNYLNLFYVLHNLSKILDIDLIRIENLLLSGPPVHAFSIIKKIPYIIWLGGNERKSLVLKYGKNVFSLLLSKIIILFERVLLSKANFVFPVTEELLELTNKRKVKNKYLSPNYVDLTKFKKILSERKDPDPNLHVLYVGRFEEEKGIRTLLKSIKILFEEIDIFELWLVGDGSLKPWIMNFISEFKMEKVKLLGKFDHDEMPKIYNSGDIFVLPSLTEGSPASLIEAMSCGTASIATKVGECVNIIKNRYNGLLVEPDNPNKLSQAIKKLILDKELREKFSKNGRKSIVNYTKNYKKIHEHVYKKILNQ